MYESAQLLADRKPKHVELMEKAKATKNADKRSTLIAEARVAKANYELRMVGKAAEAKARRALEQAGWLREGGRP